eukprot:scaffold1179_cov118-Isochrysis_galbana.AAC.10
MAGRVRSAPTASPRAEQGARTCMPPSPLSISNVRVGAPFTFLAHALLPGTATTSAGTMGSSQPEPEGTALRRRSRDRAWAVSVERP